jgi:broad specificity phosphatase PhoE
MYTIDLIRHAASLHVERTNAARVKTFGGRMSDIDLSPNGVLQARQSGMFLMEHNLRPDAVLCSTAKRTKRTYELHAEVTGWQVPYTEDKDLEEMLWGRWSNQPRDVATTPAMIKARERQGFNFTPPDGESYLQVRRRALAAIQRAVRPLPSGSYVHAYVHRNVIKALIYPLMGWSPLRILDVGPDVVSITRVVLRDGRLELEYYNMPTLTRG